MTLLLWCYVHVQVATLEAANGNAGADCNQGEEDTVTKKRKKKKKKKKAAENDTGEELPSSIDVSKAKENGNGISGLTHVYNHRVWYCVKGVGKNMMAMVCKFHLCMGSAV